MPWLMKAEPDSRVEKGRDVKFSVDDFEKIGTSQWDGVRSHEAKKIMKEKMKLGDKVLFYHSNCKVPGVYALAEVAREGYPDYTAWDPDHPYFDSKTDKENPTWYMVDVKFSQRLIYPPTLTLVKHLSTLSSSPLEYLLPVEFEAIKNMALINRGRLSVQPVDDLAWEGIVKMGMRGGWEDLVPRKVKSKSKKGVREEDQDALGETAGVDEAGKESTTSKLVEDSVKVESVKAEQVDPKSPRKDVKRTGKPNADVPADTEERRRSKRLRR